MNRFLYALVAFCALGLLSCRKNYNDQTIQVVDQTAIQAYIQQNGLNQMVTDINDTTGIYYQILNPGTGPVIDYPDKISYEYSYQTFDGKYAASDTIKNHVNNYLGHVSPTAIQLALKNIIKRKGTKARLLIPSRLAFGRNGYFVGGITINGNQCLDYTVNLIDNSAAIDPNTKLPLIDPITKLPIEKGQAAYDQVSIQKYMTANALTGFTQILPSGVWYKVTTAGTGKDVIGPNSVVSVQYNGYLLNGTLFDSYTSSDQTIGTSFSVYDVIQGWQQALPFVTAGGHITMIIPSAYAYGDAGSTNSATGSTVPPFSCLRFDITVVSVTN